MKTWKPWFPFLVSGKQALFDLQNRILIYIKVQHLYFYQHVNVAAGKLNFLPWKWNTPSQETLTWVSNFSFSTHSSSVSGWASSILRCSSFWILDASDPNSGFLGTCKRMFYSALQNNTNIFHSTYIICHTGQKFIYCRFKFITVLCDPCHKLNHTKDVTMHKMI